MRYLKLFVITVIPFCIQSTFPSESNAQQTLEKTLATVWPDVLDFMELFGTHEIVALSRCSRMSHKLGQPMFDRHADQISSIFRQFYAAHTYVGLKYCPLYNQPMGIVINRYFEYVLSQPKRIQLGMLEKILPMAKELLRGIAKLEEIERSLLKYKASDEFYMKFLDAHRLLDFIILNIHNEVTERTPEYVSFFKLIEGLGNVNYSELDLFDIERDFQRISIPSNIPRDFRHLMYELIDSGHKTSLGYLFIRCAISFINHLDQKDLSDEILWPSILDWKDKVPNQQFGILIAISIYFFK